MSFTASFWTKVLEHGKIHANLLIEVI